MALLRLLCALPVLLLIAVRADSEGNRIEVDAHVGRRTIAVGDTFRLDIDLRWEEGVNVKPLALGENLGDFSVRDLAYGPISAGDSYSARRISLLLTVFETGVRTVPPIAVVYMDQNGSAGKAETPPIEIEVRSVLPDEAADIKDIKGPIEVPRRWKDIILSWALLVGLGTAAATSVLVSVKRREELEEIMRRIWLRVTGPVVGLVRWFLRRLSLMGRDEYGSPAFDARMAEPYLTPEQAALKEFDRIEALGLREQGRTEELNTLVSEAVRRYLERKFRVLAMESPTSHTMIAIRHRDVSPEALGLVQDVLEETDLVKFARFRPREEAALTLIDRGRQVVHKTASRVTGEAVEEAHGI